MDPCTGTKGYVQAVGPIRGVEVLLYSFLTTALQGGEGSASRPSRFSPPGKTQYPLYRRLVGRRAGLAGGKSRLHRDSIPGPSSL